MTKKQYFQKLNKDFHNRGAALISVLIVMTVVSILGMLSLSVAYNAFLMKNVEKKATGNFYEAEAILDEITAGIQNVVSASHNKAYNMVMANYGSYDTAEEIQMEYEAAFLDAVVVAMEGTIVDGYYDIDILKGFVDTDEYSGTIAIEQVKDDAGNSLGLLDRTITELYLRNLSVKYMKNGYADKITTDIVISVPDITFAKITNAPQVMEYAMLADKGIEVEVPTSVSGKIFAGIIVDPLAVVQEKATSIHLKTGSSLSMSGDSSVVSEGTIELSGKTGFSADVSTEVWAESVKTDAGTVVVTEGESNINVSLLGKTYIKDDLTLDGKANSLTLGGQYFGYSTSSFSADDSSAIIVNGTNTKINMSSLDSLVLAGTAFVGTNGRVSQAAGAALSSGVAMGESVAVKSNQLIYMVPAECFESFGGGYTNPMSSSKFTQLTNSVANWESQALSATISGLGRSIASYGSVEITPIYPTGDIVYLYLEFSDTKTAGEFFVDAYGKSDNGKKAKEYMKNYLESMQFSGAARAQIITAGNYLVSGASGSAPYKAATKEIQDINLGETFTEKCEELRFENLIDVEELRELIGTDEGRTEFTGTATIPSTQYGIAGKTVQVRVVDNEGGTPYEINSSFDGLLIATGDVKIVGSAEDTIEGMILCKGTVSVTGTETKISCNSDITSYALRIANADGMTVAEIFDGNTGISSGAIIGNTSEEKDEKAADLRDSVTFVNWKSE